MNDAQRTQAYLDTLTRVEHDVADRVLGMPGGSMAVAYVAVGQHRLEKALEFLPVKVAAELERTQKNPIKGDILNGAAIAAYAIFTFMFGPPHR